jgi:hypothetical protein
METFDDDAVPGTYDNDDAVPPPPPVRLSVEIAGKEFERDPRLEANFEDERLRVLFRELKPQAEKIARSWTFVAYENGTIKVFILKGQRDPVATLRLAVENHLQLEGTPVPDDTVRLHLNRIAFYSGITLRSAVAVLVLLHEMGQLVDWELYRYIIDEGDYGFTCVYTGAVRVRTDEERAQDDAQDDVTYPSPDVTNPGHYRTGDVECIDAMRAAWGTAAAPPLVLGALMQAFQYMWRAFSHQDSPEVQLRKARWWIQYALHTLNPEKEPDPRNLFR